MLQRTQHGSEVMLNAGEFGTLEIFQQQATAQGGRRQLAALQKESRRLAHEAVARVSREEDSLANATNGTAPRVGANDSAQANIVTMIIEKLNNSIMAGMVADHMEDQKEVNKQVAFIKQCHTTMLAENQTTVATMRAGANAKAEENRQCQVAEAALRQQRETLCSAAHQHFIDNIKTMNCVLGDNPDAGTLKTHLDCVKAFADKISAAEAEYWKCKNATSSLTNKTAECTATQDAYDSALCSFETAANITCGSYDQCYAQEVGRYESVKTGVQAVEAGRKTEAVSVAKIRCYLNVILKPAWQLEGDAGTALLRSCDEINSSAEEPRFDITYPPVPGASPCNLAGEAVELPAPAVPCPSLPQRPSPSPAPSPQQPVCAAYLCPPTHLPVYGIRTIQASTTEECCVLQPSIAGHWSISVFGGANGTAWVAGHNVGNMFGNDKPQLVPFPDQVHFPGGQRPKIVKVACGQNHILLLDANGDVWGAGSNGQGQLTGPDRASKETYTKLEQIDNVVDIAAGTQTSLFLRGDGTAWGVGTAHLGSLGDIGQTRNDWVWPPYPRKIPGLDGGVAGMAHGTYHALWLMKDGTVRGSGRNKNGERGLGIEYRYSNPKHPTEIPGIVDAVQVSALKTLSVILLRDGTVRACGENDKGQLGRGTTSPQSEFNPIERVQGVTGVISVAASYRNIFFVLSDGSVMGTGENLYGQLADGTVVDKSMPVVIPGLANATRVFAGQCHAFFLLKNGTVRATGCNHHGAMLGDPATTPTSAGPVTVKLASGEPMKLT